MHTYLSRRELTNKDGEIYLSIYLIRRELTNKDEEIEEARASANKKVKILEQQLEQVI